MKISLAFAIVTLSINIMSALKIDTTSARTPERLFDSFNKTSNSIWADKDASMAVTKLKILFINTGIFKPFFYYEVGSKHVNLNNNFSNEKIKTIKKVIEKAKEKIGYSKLSNLQKALIYEETGFFIDFNCKCEKNIAICIDKNNNNSIGVQLSAWFIDQIDHTQEEHLNALEFGILRELAHIVYDDYSIPPKKRNAFMSLIRKKRAQYFGMELMQNPRAAIQMQSFDKNIPFNRIHRTERYNADLDSNGFIRLINNGKKTFFKSAYTMMISPEYGLPFKNNLKSAYETIDAWTYLHAYKSESIKIETGELIKLDSTKASNIIASKQLFNNFITHENT